MRTDDYKIAILKMAKGKEFHGYEAHKRLASENIEIELSRLYRILNDMLREGLLEGRWTRSQIGPRMRVYRVGEKGEEEHWMVSPSPLPLSQRERGEQLKEFDDDDSQSL